jgi:hypothetical protein
LAKEDEMKSLLQKSIMGWEQQRFRAIFLSLIVALVWTSRASADGKKFLPKARRATLMRAAAARYRSNVLLMPHDVRQRFENAAEGGAIKRMVKGKQFNGHELPNMYAVKPEGVAKVLNDMAGHGDKRGLLVLKFDYGMPGDSGAGGDGHPKVMIFSPDGDASTDSADNPQFGSGGIRVQHDPIPHWLEKPASRGGVMAVFKIPAELARSEYKQMKERQRFPIACTQYANRLFDWAARRSRELDKSDNNSLLHFPENSHGGNSNTERDRTWIGGSRIMRLLDGQLSDGKGAGPDALFIAAGRGSKLQHHHDPKHSSDYLTPDYGKNDNVFPRRR